MTARKLNIQRGKEKIAKNNQPKRNFNERERERKGKQER